MAPPCGALRSAGCAWGSTSPAPSDRAPNAAPRSTARPAVRHRSLCGEGKGADRRRGYPDSFHQIESRKCGECEFFEQTKYFGGVIFCIIKYLGTMNAGFWPLNQKMVSPNIHNIHTCANRETYWPLDQGGNGTVPMTHPSLWHQKRGRKRLDWKDWRGLNIQLGWPQGITWARFGGGVGWERSPLWLSRPCGGGSIGPDFVWGSRGVNN